MCSSPNQQWFIQLATHVGFLKRWIEFNLNRSEPSIDSIKGEEHPLVSRTKIPFFFFTVSPLQQALSLFPLDFSSSSYLLVVLLQRVNSLISPSTSRFSAGKKDSSSLFFSYIYIYASLSHCLSLFLFTSLFLTFSVHLRWVRENKKKIEEERNRKERKIKEGEKRKKRTG